MCKQCRDVCVICAERDCKRKGGTKECKPCNWSCDRCGRGHSFG